MAVFSVPIELDKQRNLRFGFKAMVALESLYDNRGFTDIVEEIRINPKMGDIQKVFWAGLQWEDSELTMGKTADILDDCNLADVLSKLMEAVNVALKAKNSQAGAEKKKKKNPTPA
jgi:hypothetical protein